MPDDPLLGAALCMAGRLAAPLALPLAPLVGTCPTAVTPWEGGRVHPWLQNTSFTAQTYLHFFLTDSQSTKAMMFNVVLEHKLYLLYKLYLL